AGLGYNQANLKYSQNDPYSQPGMMNMFGNEEFKTSYATATVMAGTEILITPGFGINLEAAYSTGLGDGFSSKNSQNPFNSPDQVRLRDLGKEIIGSNALSIFAGAVVNF